MPLHPSTYHRMISTRLTRTLHHSGIWACVASIVAGCTIAPSPPPTSTVVTPTTPSSANAIGSSYAATPRDYRRDAATHLYAKYGSRVFAGKLPPQLYAVGVLQVEINGKGAVTGMHWMRAPSHAPEVVAEIERSVRAAAPFPTPIKMGRVTYTDTWLWDKSGQFQLDTLTEGQL